MGYPDGEALILTQIQQLSNFNSNNTSRANWKILNKGRSRQYVVLYPGGFEDSSLGMGGNYSTDWTTICEVWVRYKDDSTTISALTSRVGEIIARFRAYRKAGDTTGSIRDVFVRSGEKPEEMWTGNGDGPSWVRQTLEIQWSEEGSVTLQE